MPHAPVFISARFRSGSTLLWNMFRHMPGCLAYYEPCHENLLANAAINAPAGQDHVNVSSYWDEYQPLAGELAAVHKGEFGSSRLYLDADADYPELERYIRFLVDSAGEKTAVLQFNRMDFRLGWLKKRFPEAAILHLERDPRENWFSMVRGLPEGAWKDPLCNARFDLVLWSLALHADLPFLFCERVRTSYHRHFVLWRLSGLMARRYADHRLDFENDLVGDTHSTIRTLARLAGVIEEDRDAIAALVSPPPRGRWEALAPPEWFDEAEADCDALLEELGLLDGFGESSPGRIRAEHSARWEPLSRESVAMGMEAVTRLVHETRDEQYAIWRMHHEGFARLGVNLSECRDRLREAVAEGRQRLKDIESLRSEKGQLLDKVEKLELALDDLRTENRISRDSLAQAQALLAGCEARLRGR